MPLTNESPDINFNAPPILLYRVRLDQSGWIPTVDPLHLKFFYGCRAGAQINSGYYTGEGMWLQLGRSSSETERSELLWNFSPFPSEMLGCYISADFQLVTGGLKPPDPFAPDGLGDRWAASVIVRDGEPAVTDDCTTFAGATHQVIGGPTVQVTLGAAGATAVPSPEAIAVQALQAHDPSLAFSFSLGTLIDCYTGQGRSHLKTSGGYYWENTFTHPFGPLPKPPKTITCVGCGVAFAKGSGSGPGPGPGAAQVIVKEFRVQVWPVLPPTQNR